MAAGTPALVNDKLGLRELARHFGGAVFSIRMDKVGSLELAKAIEDVAGIHIGRVDLNDFQWRGSQLKPYAYTKKSPIRNQA